MGYGNCGTDSKGRGIGYAHEAQCDHPDCSKIIDRGMSYACGGEHGETEYSCEGYFCEGHKRQPFMDDDHLFYQYNVGTLCDDCADAVELDEKESKESERQKKIKLDPELLQCGEFDRPFYESGPMKVKDAPEYKDDLKMRKYQWDALRRAMETPSLFPMMSGMGATNTSLGKDMNTPPKLTAYGSRPITGRWKASDVHGARTGIFPAKNPSTPADGVFKDEASAKTHVVRGDLTVTFTDKAIYEAVRNGQEVLNKRLTEMATEAIVSHNRKMMKDMLGRTQYADEIQKLETKKKDSGLNAVETGTLMHLKMMDRIEKLRLAYGGGRTIDVQKALEAEMDLYGGARRSSRHLTPCPQKLHFNIKTNHPEFTPGKGIQSESHLHRSGEEKPEIHEMDLADIEKRVLAYMAEKIPEAYHVSVSAPEPSDVKEVRSVTAPLKHVINVSGKDYELDLVTLRALEQLHDRPTAGEMWIDEHKVFSTKVPGYEKHAGVLIRLDGRRIPLTQEAMANIIASPIHEVYSTLKETEAAHLSFKPEKDFVGKPSSEDNGQLDIGKDEKGRVYYVGTSVPEGMEMDYGSGEP